MFNLFVWRVGAISPQASLLSSQLAAGEQQAGESENRRFVFCVCSPPARRGLLDFIQSCPLLLLLVLLLKILVEREPCLMVSLNRFSRLFSTCPVMGLSTWLVPSSKSRRSGSLGGAVKSLCRSFSMKDMWWCQRFDGTGTPTCVLDNWGSYKPPNLGIVPSPSTT